jgi:hypothetical protein
VFAEVGEGHGCLLILSTNYTNLHELNRPRKSAEKGKRLWKKRVKIQREGERSWGGLGGV